MSPQFSRRASRRHFTGFPSPSRARRGGERVRVEEAARAPAPSTGPRRLALEGPAPGTPGLPRLRARGDPCSPAFLPVAGRGAGLQTEKTPRPVCPSLAP